jgi:predicted small lipoprotein YifL
MTYRSVIWSVMLVLLLSSCGLKRNLELPDNEKRKQTPTSQTTEAPASTQAPASVPASTTAGGM